MIRDVMLTARLRAAIGETVRITYTARCYLDSTGERIPMYGMAHMPPATYSPNVGVAEGRVEQIDEYVVILHVKGIRVAVILGSIISFTGKPGKPEVE